MWFKQCKAYRLPETPDLQGRHRMNACFLANKVLTDEEGA